MDNNLTTRGLVIEFVEKLEGGFKTTKEWWDKVDLLTEWLEEGPWVQASELEELLEDARKEGYDEGYDEGLNDAEEN